VAAILHLPYVAEKYPRQDMGVVVKSFGIKMSRGISETQMHTKSQRRGGQI